MFKKVLVYTYGDQSHEATIQAAAAFATHHNAELSGLFVQPDYCGYATIYGEHPFNLAKTFYDLQSEYAKRSRTEYEQLVAHYDCSSQWHEINEYEERSQPFLYADIIFVSQPDTQSSVIFNDTDFVDRLIMETGLPLVVVPKNWAGKNFAQRPVLGWKETREAAAAMRYGLPIMRAAEQVNVVTVTNHADLDEELLKGIGISEYLTEHAVNCKYFYTHMLESERDESETLIRHARSEQCDFIIIGGYGHSRFREIILGGMTRDLIKQSPVPVLISH